jgi:hypothetical protein
METGIDRFQQLVIAPLQAAAQQLLSYVPTILGAILILLVGGIIAKVLEKVIVRGLKFIGLDRIADQVQISSILDKGGIQRSISEVIGLCVYWFIVLAFVMTALNALNLTIAAELFQQIISFLPNVVAAVFILIVGIFAAAFLSAVIRTAASNSGIVQAHLLGQVVQAVVVIFSIVAALQQLQIQFVGEVFLIILSGFSLACALAFGLGCKELAGKWVADVVRDLQARRR